MLQLILIVVLLAMSFSLLLAAVYVAYKAGKWAGTPIPISAYKSNHEVFKDFVYEVNQGTASTRPDGQGFVISASLADLGVSYVRDRDGYVFFIFESLPFQATEQIIFVQDLYGFPETPELARKSRKKVFEFQRIDHNWYYLRTD